MKEKWQSITKGTLRRKLAAVLTVCMAVTLTPGYSWAGNTVKNGRGGGKNSCNSI